jgi:hypothetical protein
MITFIHLKYGGNASGRTFDHYRFTNIYSGKPFIFNEKEYTENIRPKTFQ